MRMLNIPSPWGQWPRAQILEVGQVRQACKDLRLLTLEPGSSHPRIARLIRRSRRCQRCTCHRQHAPNIYKTICRMRTCQRVRNILWDYLPRMYLSACTKHVLRLSVKGAHVIGIIHHTCYDTGALFAANVRTSLYKTLHKTICWRCFCWHWPN